MGSSSVFASTSLNTSLPHFTLTEIEESWKDYMQMLSDNT
jgi:hypothetical protein